MELDQQSFTPLQSENRAVVETDCAAWHLNREPQTLRVWASRGCGPIQPLRVHGRLMWPVAELRKLVGLGDPKAAA